VGTDKSNDFDLSVPKLVVVIGLFEEEEGGIGVISEVLEVKGEDADTRGYLRGDRAGRDDHVENPWNS